MYPALGHFYASRGYVFVVQDVRGRGDSDGTFGFWFADGDDGYDTIEWLAAQPWSDGKIGMLGGSYLGTVQWLAARAAPPHLACIIPQASAGRYFDEMFYQGGVFTMELGMTWVNMVSARLGQSPNAALIDWERVYWHRPLLTMDEALGRRMPLYRDLLAHSTIDAYWKRLFFSPDDFRKINIPAFTFTAWFDGLLGGSLSYWEGMRKYSPARDRQHLIIGPWTHPGVAGVDKLGLRVGEMEFSGDSVVELNRLQLAFFDHYLKGTAPTFTFPRARIYVTGTNTWRDFEDYPPPQAQTRRLYLHSGGRANTLQGDGTLSWEPPGNEAADRYVHNPRNPVPAYIDGQQWGVDQRMMERRDDVLVYTSLPLDNPLEAIGKLSLVFHAASDARDTDFLAKIIDVYPDGRAVRLGGRMGAIRARYRKGYDREVLLTPNQPEEFTIDLFGIGHTFLPGHQIRIEISSSAYPRFNPNPNTGNPLATDTEWKVARQTIYHESQRPSYVLLPVMPSQEALPIR